MMGGWTAADLLPGLYVALLALGLAAVLRRWYDPVPARVLALFGVLLVVLFGRVLFGGGVLLPLDNLRLAVPFRYLPAAETLGHGIHGDLVHQIAPWQLEVRRALADGRWPLWNANAGAGMPLMADPQAQAFQPLVVAAYPFSLWAAAGITAALRVLVALVFLFLLLRRQGLGEPAAVAGSLAFGLGGFLMLWLGWPMANSPALLPMVLYALVRCDDSGRPRDFLLLALAVFSLLLGGHPETIVYTLAVAGLFLLARAGRRVRLLARCGLAMALAGAAAAPVLLPVADYLPKTDRAAIGRFILAPRPVGELWERLWRPETQEAWRERTAKRLTPVVAPRAFGDYQFYWGRGNIIEDAGGFAGSATLLAAAAALLPFGRRRRFPQERLTGAVLAGCLLLLAQPPGFENLVARLPLIGATAIHQHQRVLMVVAFCLAYLAACEVERRARKEGSPWVTAIAAIFVSGLVLWATLSHPAPLALAQMIPFQMRWMAIQLVALALATALLAARPGRWTAWAFCGVIAGELLLAHLPSHPAAPRRLAYPVTPPVRFLQEHLGDDRMLGLGGSAFPANFPAVYGLNDVRIDNPSFPYSYARLTAPLRRSSLPPIYGRPSHPLWDLLGVRYVIARSSAVIPLKRVFRHTAGSIYERPHALPRLFLPYRARVQPEGATDWLERNPDFALRAMVAEVPEGGGRAWRAARPQASGLSGLALEPARVRALAHLAEPRLLASSVYQDGHWHLVAGGERRPTVLANGPLAAAWLPAGEWRIDLLYRPLLLIWGCLLAALAWTVAFVWWVPRPSRVLSSSHAHGSRSDRGPD